MVSKQIMVNRYIAAAGVGAQDRIIVWHAFAVAGGSDSSMVDHCTVTSEEWMISIISSFAHASDRWSSMMRSLLGS